MLAFDRTTLSDWENIKNLTPQQYLSWRLRRAFEENKTDYERMKDIGYELVLRNNCVEEVCVDPSKFWAFASKNLPNLSEETKGMISEGFEAMKDPSRPGLLDHIIPVCLSMSGDAQDRLHQVPVGLAPISIFNAGAGPVPKGGEIVLLNHGLHFGIEILLDYHNKVLDDMSGSLDDMVKKLIANSNVVVAIFSSLNGMPLIHSFPYDVLIPPIFGEDRHAGIRQLCDVLMFFVLLHEYGHIVLGHVEELRSRPPLWMLSKQQLKETYAQMRKWELEADLWACTRLISNLSREHRNEALIYLAHLFSILHISYYLLRSEGIILPTHPSGQYRYNKIMKSFNFNRNERKEVKHIRDVWYLLAALSDINVKVRF